MLVLLLTKVDPIKPFYEKDDYFFYCCYVFRYRIEYNVYLKNISTADTLIIQDIRVGCGCTTPKFKTADKILPGKSTFITLGFNGGSAPGDFSKFADILFRGGLVKQVKFHGTAVPPGQ